MRLPNADEAIIAERKLGAYLLDLSAKDASKARLFAALGYTQDNWQQFEADIRSQHLTRDAVEVAPNEFGRRWRIEAELRGPLGSAMIRTTWIILFGEDTPHLTSAYRIRRRR